MADDRSLLKIGVGDGPERSNMKKETLEKITVWMCWSILMAGAGYAWAYHQLDGLGVSVSVG